VINNYISVVNDEKKVGVNQNYIDFTGRRVLVAILNNASFK
jgi:hypothetical protein